MRTFLVFVGGAIVAIVVEIILGQWLTPDAGQVITKMFTTPPNDTQWNALSRQLNHIHSIALYVIAPLGGFAAGKFVGLFQRKHVIALAALCLVPDFVELLWADHSRYWASSAPAFLRFVLVRSLPFLAAIVAAAICKRWVWPGQGSSTHTSKVVEASN